LKNQLGLSDPSSMAESTLLEGAMVRGAEDNSAIFYNQGALLFIVNPTFQLMQLFTEWKRYLKSIFD
jgi:hypothetical protein